jgi:chorismate synthase
MSFTFKDRISISIFGSSHGSALGCILDGIPSGFRIDENKVSLWMSRRAPGQSSLTTQRKETDQVEFISGINNCYTDGGPITMLIRNKDVIERHYDELKEKPRPGHGDLSLFLKYGPYRNYSGGGFLSGRMTAPLVAAGSVAIQLLAEKDIQISSYLQSMGDIRIKEDRFYDDSEVYDMKSRIPDSACDEEAEGLIRHLQSQGDSTGGIVKTVVRNVPAGMGEPFFDSVESVVSHLMFSVPGVKGIEFGEGFNLGRMNGSTSNDSFHMMNGKVTAQSNHNGGVLGGITYGNDIEFRTVFKATSSIRKEQETVDIKNWENTTIRVQGRHDPCIAIRAVPVVKCVTALSLLNLYLRRQSSYKGNFVNESSYGKDEWN